MARPKQDVTETELEIMEILWGSGGATVRGLAGRIYPRGGFAHYTTVKKLIERLEAKGFVKRKTDQTAHEFSAAVGRDELIARRLRAMADELCGGSLTPLLTGLVQTRSLKPGEIQELRDMIERLDRSRKRK